MLRRRAASAKASFLRVASASLRYVGCMALAPRASSISKRSWASGRCACELPSIARANHPTPFRMAHSIDPMSPADVATVTSQYERLRSYIGRPISRMATKNSVR